MICDHRHILSHILHFILIADYENKPIYRFFKGVLLCQSLRICG
jgi:hypothetical protein